MKVFTLILRKILLYDFIYYIVFIISIILIVFRINTFSVNYEYINRDYFIGIISDFYVNEEYLTFVLEDDVKIQCNYYFDEDYFFDLSLGDKVKVNGEIYIPSENTNKNLFNYRNYLKSKNIYYAMNVSNYEKISSNSNLFYDIKNFIISMINENSSFKYLYAFILGDTRYIDSSAKSSYQELGISHLFSISGMHISILSSIILFLLKKINLNEEYRYLLVCIFITFFMFLVNLCPSVLRSGIFFILLAINNIFYLHIKPINLLLVTISFIIILNPFIIYNNGFLYSSIITGSLMVFGNLINKYNNYIAKLFMTSFISFLFSFPLSIYSYFQINILSVFYNLIFVPLVSIIIFPLSLVCLFLPVLSFLLNPLIDIMEFLAIKFSLINSNIIFMKPSLLVLFLYYFLIFIMFYFKKKFLYFIYLVFVFIHYNYNVFFSNNYIFMIDIGQGDSVLLHSGSYNILVDTGGISYGDSSLSKNTLVPLFKSLGIRKIDYLFLSHGDYDHLGEAVSLINDFSVERVYFNEGEINVNEREIISLLERKNIDYFISYEGDYYEVGDYMFYSLGTDLVDENDSSMILYGLIEDYSFLLMGDASIKSEEVLLSKYSIFDIDILKVGHHGSRTSSGIEFIDNINPKYSLISAGRDNKFGHPNKEVLDNLSNSKIYRTDQDGSIMFKIKKNKLEIETCVPKKGK